jgi:hypothetical protein
VEHQEAEAERARLQKQLMHADRLATLGQLAAAMVGKTIGRAIDAHQLPVYVERFGSTKEEIFVTASGLRKEFGNGDFEKIPPRAIGLHTYYERLAQGLRQLMAGCRKFSLERISRDDVAALTSEAAEITGLRYIMEVDEGRAEGILDS